MRTIQPLPDAIRAELSPEVQEYVAALEAKAVVAGRYELLYELGRGQWGAVDLALNLGTRTLHAVKTIDLHRLPPASKSPSDDPRLRGPIPDSERVDAGAVCDALRRVMQQLAGLRGPRLVELDDVGIDYERNVLYLVMPYVPAWSLSFRLIQDGRFGVGRALLVAKQAAAALDSLHSKSLVHGDLKSSNVLLTADDNVWLTGAGLYRVLGDGPLRDDRPRLPHFLAPECHEMPAGHRRGPAVDIYALGVILFEMLTRRYPFEANTAVELFEKRAHTPAPSVSEFNEEVPPAVNELVARCLSVNPERRYRNGRDLAEEIERILLGRPGDSTVIVTPHEPPPERSVSFPPVTIGAFPAALIDRTGHIYPLRPKTGEMGQPVWIVGRSVAADAGQPGGKRTTVDVDLAVDRSVSRLHARIYREGNRWMIRHVAPRNRTLVDGRPVDVDRPERLRDGAVCRFGNLELLFRLGQ